MKHIRRTFIAMVLLLVLVGTTVPSRAWIWWVDELGDCSNTFITTATAINQTMQVDTQEWRDAQDAAMQQMENCVGVLNTPTHEPDFCDAARAARDQCVAQFYGLGLEFTGARMECIMASGINLCE